MGYFAVIDNRFYKTNCDTGGAEKEPGRRQTPVIYLRPAEEVYFFVNGQSRRAYNRIRCNEWDTSSLPIKQLVGNPYNGDVLVLQDEQHELAMRAEVDAPKMH